MKKIGILSVALLLSVVAFSNVTKENNNTSVADLESSTTDFVNEKSNVKKVALRNARRDCLDMYKQMKKDNEISEDEYANLEEEVQKIQDKYIAMCDEESANKEKEVMEI